MINIVLFGPPGSGKGTQSDNIINKFNLTHISTGDLFREHLDQGTELGKLAQKYMDDGNLIPDEIVIKMVDNKLKENNDNAGYIFDGFPRTVPQALALDRLLEDLEMPINLTIALEVDDNELKNRILERGKTSGRVDDQSKEKVENRIRVYKEETLPVANYYKNQNKFYSINGIGPIEDIANNISRVIEEYTRQKTRQKITWHLILKCTFVTNFQFNFIGFCSPGNGAQRHFDNLILTLCARSFSSFPWIAFFSDYMFLIPEM